MNTLDQFVRHAERFGTEFVFETAAARLGSPDLGHLARHLRRIDRRWRLSPADRAALAAGLVVAGIKTVDIVDLAGVSYSTVASLRAAGRGVAETTPQPTEPCALVSTETQDAVFVSNPAQTALFEPAGAPAA
jgi:hypothetical protein